MVLAIFLFFLTALVYSMVGLAGGSAYVGILALLNTDIRYIPSTAQFLNIVVSSIGFLNFKKHFDKGKLKLIVLIYFSGILGVIWGTEIALKENVFFIVLGSLLITSSLVTFLKNYIPRINFRLNHSFLPVISFILGFLTGLCGIGGGIFLSPILFFAGFPVKEIASITTLFIFLNSGVGFVKNAIVGRVDFLFSISLGFVVAFGGFCGSYLGSSKLSSKSLEKILIFIIAIIGVRLLWKGITST